MNNNKGNAYKTNRNNDTTPHTPGSLKGVEFLEVVGYVGIKNEASGTLQVCQECAKVQDNAYKNGAKSDGHDFAPVYSNDVFISLNGGMTCNYCQARFI